jgi:hypothetical protein
MAIVKTAQKLEEKGKNNNNIGKDDPNPTSENQRPKTGINRDLAIERKIRKAPSFLYLMKNKNNLIEKLKNDPIQYEKIQKRDAYRYYYVDSDIPKPGYSLTDRIHKLLYYELKTNVDLMAFEGLTDDEKTLIRIGKKVSINVDFGNENIRNVVFDREKYEKVQILHNRINTIFEELIDEKIKTNRELIDMIGKLKVSRVKPYLNNLIHDIRDIANSDIFNKDEQRFDYNVRTAEDKKNPKKYKLKYDYGFMEVAEGHRLGGLSEPELVIKRILSPDEKFNKYKNTWIKKTDQISPTTEIYKAKVLEVLGLTDSKIRLQDKNRKVEYIKMNENAHILADSVKDNNLVKDNNFQIKNIDLVKNVLISYLFFIGDRHSENLMNDLNHIDFGDEKKYILDNKGELIAKQNLELSHDKKISKAIERNDFKYIQNVLCNHMDGAWYDDFLQNQFAKIPKYDFEKYCQDALNDIFKQLKNPKVLQELNEINEDYKRDMAKENRKNALSNLFAVETIIALSDMRSR